MKDEEKTKEQLINESVVLRQQIAEYEEVLKTDYNRAKEALKNNFSIIGTVSRSVHESINLQNVIENAVKSMHKNIKGADTISIYLVEGKEAGGGTETIRGTLSHPLRSITCRGIYI